MTELMVVLAIISILLGIGGVGLLSNLPQYRLKSAARELVSVMQKARLEAVKRNIDCRVVFDVANARYAVSIDNGADGSWSTIGDNENLKVVSLNDYGSGVEYGSGSATFDATASKGTIPSDFVSYSSNIATYNPRGTSSGGYVYLSNQSNDAYAVGTRITGAVTNKRWTGSNWSE